MNELATWIQERFATVKIEGVDLRKYKIRSQDHGDGTCTLEVLNLTTNQTASGRMQPDQMKCLKTAAEMVMALENGEKPKAAAHQLRTSRINDISAEE